MKTTIKITLIAFAATSIACEAWAQALPGAMIDIGGHSVHLVCSGEGERTILLDAGAGGWSFTWLPAQTELAAAGFQVCAWDRPGVGLSDVGPLPRTSATIVREMRALIDAAQLATPIVLVGHSFGGQNVRLFAATYPDAVAGIVLVDSGHEQQWTRFDVPESVRDNLLRLTFHPDALRRRIVNFHVVGPVMIARAERELAEAPSDRQLEELIEEIRSYGPVPPVVPREDVPAGLLLPIQLRKGPVNVRLFSVVSTIGAAIDVTLQELRIESFFPADEASEATLAVLLAGAATGDRDAASGTGTGRLAAKGPKTARGCFAFRSPRDRLGLNHLAGV